MGWVVEEKVPLGGAVDKISRFASLDTDDIRRILTGAGFSEDEINGTLPADDISGYARHRCRQACKRGAWHQIQIAGGLKPDSK